MPRGKAHIVVIGGGTGSFAILSGLRERNMDITALVNMSDDGGSTGQLRDQLGVLPPGDVRQCLVALSDASDSLRELFNYRFPAGSDFSGHSFGNLFLSATEKMTHDFGEAVALASEVLHIHGQVVPETLDKSRLVLRTTDGNEVIGQFAAKMYEVPSLRGADVSYVEPVHLNPIAHEALLQADVIVFAPGDLYTSLAPTLAVSGIQEVLMKTSAPLVYVCNLVNKPRHTVDYTVSDYADELQRFLGRRTLDYVLYNVDNPSSWRLKAYALEGEYPVIVNEDTLATKSYVAIPGAFLSRSKQARNANDSFIFRSLIRHSGDAVAAAIESIVIQQKDRP